MNYHRHANDPDRRKWQNPEAILINIGLKTGFTFIDIGCGGGFFALPAAKIVGENGKVYGIDNDAESIHELEELAGRERLSNLYLTIGKAEDVVLCESCADIIFFGMALHDFENPVKVLENSKKMLNRSGRLINLDWKKVPMDIGPPVRKRFTEEQAVELIEKANLLIENIEDTNPYYYIIVARV